MNDKFRKTYNSMITEQHAPQLEEEDEKLVSEAEDTEEKEAEEKVDDTSEETDEKTDDSKEEEKSEDVSSEKEEEEEKEEEKVEESSKKDSVFDLLMKKHCSYDLAEEDGNVNSESYQEDEGVLEEEEEYETGEEDMIDPDYTNFSLREKLEMVIDVLESCLENLGDDVPDETFDDEYIGDDESEFQESYEKGSGYKQTKNGTKKGKDMAITHKKGAKNTGEKYGKKAKVIKEGKYGDSLGHALVNLSKGLELQSKKGLVKSKNKPMKKDGKKGVSHYRDYTGASSYVTDYKYGPKMSNKQKNNKSVGDSLFN